MIDRLIYGFSDCLGAWFIGWVKSGFFLYGSFFGEIFLRGKFRGEGVKRIVRSRGRCAGTGSEDAVERVWR